MLIILIHLGLKSISQTSNDSSLISIPAYQLKKAINLIEKGRVMEEELSATNRKVLLLNESLNNKDRIISEYSTKDSLSQKTIEGYKAVVGNLETTIANEKKINLIAKVQNRRQKFKKWISLAIGVGIGFIITK